MQKNMIIRAYEERDLPQMICIWNRIVDDGVAFPQLEQLNENSGADFFAKQSLSAVAAQDDTILGLYILHPNNVGRCSHIANASYAVRPDRRGQRIGRALVEDSLTQAKKLGFTIMQFNAVVERNVQARKLYESIGFHPLGIIPKGFRMKDGSYENICPYYIEL